MNLEKAKVKLEELEKVREEILKLTRELRLLSTKAIASVHSKGDHKKYLKDAIEIFKKILEYKKYDEIFYSLTQDAFQEFVEAYFLSKAIEERFDFEIDFDVPPSSFLTGLADLVGELRRCALTSMMRNEFESAKKFLDLMEKIYNELIQFSSFPDKLVPNLRQKLDIARSLVDRTKSDYITSKLHESLGRDR
ncbi:MAG: translin [Archaeoglobaceae archaeon]|nr:translin [Archaeoglobaceae archaeon]MCX8152054.1 translin [Archaeoglobaceae archaeon]